MQNIESRNLIEQANSLIKSKNYRALAQLTDVILAAQPDDFFATYFRGLAAMGQSDENLGQSLIRRAESARPEVRKFGFMAPFYRHLGRPEVRSLCKRIVTMELFSTTDAFLLSFPKCGRTWVRFMLGAYALKGGPGDPLTVVEISATDPTLTSLEISHDDNPHWKPVGDIVTNKDAYQDKKVLFLARDPRDVIVSYFFQYTLRDDKHHANDSGFNGDLSAFIRQDIGGLRSVVRYYNTWATNREVPAEFKLVTYEDLQDDVRAVLKAIIEFLGWPVYGPVILDLAAQAGEFENMQQLERTDALKNFRLQPPTDGNPEGFKVRRGVVGGFRDYLTARDISWIDDYLGGELNDLFARYKYKS